MNVNKPGLPNYTGPNEGWAFWVHHEEMLEYCTDFKGRIAYILKEKPPHEQATRLAALTYLTPDEIPPALATAWTAAATATTAAIPLLLPLCEQYCAGLYKDGALLFTKEQP